jgi:hypothetical protein
MAKLSGVRIIAANVAMAVRLTDNAALPLEREDIKLEIFPPGQEATSIIPSAIVGVIRFLSAMVIRKVTAGSKKNCDKKPVITGFGLIISFLK